MEQKEIRLLSQKKRRKFKYTRFAHNMRKNAKMRRLIVAVLIVAVAGVAVLIVRNQRHNKIFDVSGFSDANSSYTVTWNGHDWEYNENINSILLIGIDSTGEMKTSDTYGEQARADNIDLISFDDVNKTVKILPISRDTMTEVPNFTSSGYETNSMRTHLGFAFSFGNGGKASSMNVCNAVSDLLYGVEVYRYVTTNIDSIGYANDLIGGVTVEVPNDDLADKYPEMTKGAKVRLTDKNVADFLRYRSTEDGSNNGRMERQQAFLQAYIEKLKTMNEDDYVEMWNQLSSDESKIKTNMSQNMFMSLISNIRDYHYDPDTDNLKIEGTNGVENGYDVFYPDEDKLKELVVTTYFK